jgi:hypothetical protein
MEGRKRRIEGLGIPMDALPDLLDTSEIAIDRWIMGVLTIEEADIIEVALSLLEVRLARLAVA